MPLPTALKNNYCKANVNASVCSNGKFRLTTIELEHNQGLSPGKAQYHKIKQETQFSSKNNIGIEWSNR